MPYGDRGVKVAYPGLHLTLQWLITEPGQCYLESSALNTVLWDMQPSVLHANWATNQLVNLAKKNNRTTGLQNFWLVLRSVSD